MYNDLETLYSIFLNQGSVSTDTRKIKKGDIFFALKGDNFNGNKYAEKALEAGAFRAVVDDETVAVDDRYLLVEDVLTTLQLLANRHRRAFDKPVIGITGSNGKTTTKELMNVVLSAEYTVHYTQGNLNNHIGVPLTLLALDLEKTDIAIIEMGANKVGDIKELSAIAMPSHGLITNIGRAHIGGFGGFEGIIRGKSELFDFIRKTNGVAFINTQDAVLQNMTKRFSDPVCYPGEEELISTDPYLHFKVAGKSYHSKLTGSYNFINISAALAMARVFDIDSAVAAQAICAYRPTNNRSQVIAQGNNKIILDAYNANPDSMRAALQNLHELKAAKKAVIVGDMMELGETSSSEHEQVGLQLKEINPDKCFLVGQQMRKAYDTYPKAEYFPSTEALLDYLKGHNLDGFLILIKGSRSMGLERVREFISS